MSGVWSSSGNIVVKGLEPFAEHGMKRLRGERYSLELTHPCQRCVVTTIDQETGTKHPDWQPYKTIPSKKEVRGPVRCLTQEKQKGLPIQPRSFQP